MDPYGISCASRAVAQLSPISVCRFHIFRPGQMALRREPDLSWAQKCLEAGSGPQWGQGTQVPSKLKYGLVGGGTSISYFPRKIGEFRIIPKN